MERCLTIGTRVGAMTTSVLQFLYKIDTSEKYLAQNYLHFVTI